MEFGIEKCAMLVTEKGKVVKPVQIFRTVKLLSNYRKVRVKSTFEF